MCITSSVLKKGNNAFNEPHLNQIEFVSIVLKIASVKEIKWANANYRNSNKGTDVLSFPSSNSTGSGVILLCPPIVKKRNYSILKQTGIMGKYVHLIIHSYLHLIGFAHDSFKDYSKVNFMLFIF